jgi:hypothetical protein
MDGVNRDLGLAVGAARSFSQSVESMPLQEAVFFSCSGDPHTSAEREGRLVAGR